MESTDKTESETTRTDSSESRIDPAGDMAYTWPRRLPPVSAGDVGDQGDAGDDLGSYVAMFREYLHEQRLWIGPAHQPLVFHIKKLCRKLDANDDAPAAWSSAYLQAIQRLDRQRPGSKQPTPGDLPGQGSIFDELDLRRATS